MISGLNREDLKRAALCEHGREEHLLFDVEEAPVVKHKKCKGAQSRKYGREVVVALGHVTQQRQTHVRHLTASRHTVGELQKIAFDVML